MPCFKGLAVSIHTPDGPIPEHSIQKQSRQSRISTYIPVPPAKVPPGSTTGKPEQSTFAISITLLTPGLNVPYSTPKSTPDDPYPRPRVVGGLPGYSSNERGKYGPSVPPYIPRTTNPNETIAAYIYFDGRAKEEVATLLRRGEETWVNSRWVSVSDSEGGGLAEREFLFREVGLERWLNGLDLQGSNKEKQDRIERRQRRLEKRQRIKKEQMDSDDEAEDDKFKRVDRNGVLRYGGEGSSPVEDIQDESGLFSDNSDSEDEPPQPEAAGQIKVALFRVLASGEIKKGEYSPQFDAHDDDEGMENGNGEGADGEIDHTTSFAKPKTLDPKTISTQTVTGIDPPESPYAVFTFFYRGEKQLRKMGIVSGADKEKTPMSAKRKSGPDFSKLGPLKSTGTVGFSGYRDPSNAKRKTKNKDADAMDSDADDEDDDRLPDVDDVDIKQENGNSHLSPEDARRTGELSEGVQKIKLKRQHSADPISEPAATRKSPHLNNDETTIGTPQSVNSTSANAGTPPDGLSPAHIDASEVVGSPFKRHRSSMPGLNSGVLGSNANDTFLPATSMSTSIDGATKMDDSQLQQHRADSAPEVKIENQIPNAGLQATIPKAEDSDEELCPRSSRSQFPVVSSPPVTPSRSKRVTSQAFSPFSTPSRGAQRHVNCDVFSPSMESIQDFPVSAERSTVRWASSTLPSRKRKSYGCAVVPRRLPKSPCPTRAEIPDFDPESPFASPFVSNKRACSDQRFVRSSTPSPSPSPIVLSVGKGKGKGRATEEELARFGESPASAAQRVGSAGSGARTFSRSDDEPQTPTPIRRNPIDNPSVVSSSITLTPKRRNGTPTPQQPWTPTPPSRNVTRRPSTPTPPQRNAKPAPTSTTSTPTPERRRNAISLSAEDSKAMATAVERASETASFENLECQMTDSVTMDDEEEDEISRVDRQVRGMWAAVVTQLGGRD